MLSNERININKQNNNSETPLHIACKNNNENIIQLLTSDSFIDINITDKEKNTALTIAYKNNNENIVKIFIIKFLY